MSHKNKHQESSNHEDENDDDHIETHNDAVDNDDIYNGLSQEKEDDSLEWGDSDDRLFGELGNNILNGGNGTDTVVYVGNRNDFELLENKDGTYTVTYGLSSDMLSGIERLSFNDGSMSVSYAVELRNTQEEVSRFYNALLGRDPDEEGLAYWTNALADKAIGGGGNTMQGVAQAFSLSAEFQAMYGSNVSNASFVNMLYQNILSRTADREGYDYWLNTLEQTGERGEMIINFSNSAEYVAKTADSIDSYLSSVSLNGYILI